MRVVLGSEEAFREEFMESIIVMLGGRRSEDECDLMLRKMGLRISLFNKCYRSCSKFDVCGPILAPSLGYSLP